MDDNTAFNSLSSIFGEDLNNLHPSLTSTIFEALSDNKLAEQYAMLSSMLSSFTSLPQSPWDQEKYLAYGANFNECVPLALSSIEVPDGFDIKQTAMQISEATKDYSRLVIDELSNCTTSLSAIQELERIHFTSLSSTPVGDKRVFDANKHRNYVDFVEFIMNLDVENIPTDELTNTANKIVSTFAKAL